MSDLLLHVGAHRTGTTSLQEFLRQNDKLLSELNIFSLCPPLTRNINLDSVNSQLPRAVVSEENILGTMEGNIWNCSLYSDAGVNLARYKTVLTQVSTIYLSVRNYADWWNSAISFCIAKGMRFPSETDINRIAASKQGWLDVIQAILNAAPDAQLAVREYGWKPENPKQQLKQITRWDELSATRVDKQPHNASPTIMKLWEKLIEIGDFEGLDRLPETGNLQVFSETQLAQLDARYLADIQQLENSKSLSFLGEVDAVSEKMTNRRTGVKSSAFKKADPETNCFLCIGKTNSSWVKEAMRLEGLPDGLFLGGNADTLVSTARKFGRDRNLAFVFRDPCSRFVSAFNARLRQGRPRYDTGWSPAEAVAFSFFSNPNELAEALNSEGERMKSAARYAFQNIFHLRNSYAHYLHSAAALKYEHRNNRIFFCCADTDLHSHANALFDAVGATPLALEPKNHEVRLSKGAEKSLTEHAIQNLREYWADEFDMYETCREIAGELGFTEGRS